MKKFSFISVIAVVAVMFFGCEQPKLDTLKGNTFQISNLLMLYDDTSPKNYSLYSLDDKSYGGASRIEFFNDGRLKCYNKSQEDGQSGIHITIYGSYKLENDILSTNIHQLVFVDNINDPIGEWKTYIEERNKIYQFEVKYEKDRIDLFLMN